MKKIIILMLFIILTGCNAKYNLEYIDGEFKEDLNILNGKSKELNGIPIDEYLNYNISINYLDDQEELALNENLNKYKFYNKSLIDDGSNYGINLNYKFSQSEISDSFIMHILFNSIIINNSKLKFSDINNVFTNYEDLKNIEISFKTDKIVENSNADKVEDDVYYWFINKNNYKDKEIEILFNEEETRAKFEKINNIKYEVVILILLLVLIIAVFIFYIKFKKANKM